MEENAFHTYINNKEIYFPVSFKQGRGRINGKKDTRWLQWVMAYPDRKSVCVNNKLLDESIVKLYIRSVFFFFFIFCWEGYERKCAKKIYD